MNDAAFGRASAFISSVLASSTPAITAWLGDRGVLAELRSADSSQAIEHGLDRASVLLARHRPRLDPLLQTLSNTAPGMPTPYGLSGTKNADIVTITAFVESLRDAGIISFEADQRARTFVVTLADSSQLDLLVRRNGWFERYALMRLVDALLPSTTDLLIGRNLNVTLPDDTKSELDAFVLVANNPLLLECTTGNTIKHVPRLRKVAGYLHLADEQFMLAVPSRGPSVGRDTAISTPDEMPTRVASFISSTPSAAIERLAKELEDERRAHGESRRLYELEHHRRSEAEKALGAAKAALAAAGNAIARAESATADSGPEHRDLRASALGPQRARNEVSPSPSLSHVPKGTDASSRIEGALRERCLRIVKDDRQAINEAVVALCRCSQHPLTLRDVSEALLRDNVATKGQLRAHLHCLAQAGLCKQWDVPFHPPLSAKALTHSVVVLFSDEVSRQCPGLLDHPDGHRAFQALTGCAPVVGTRAA